MSPAVPLAVAIAATDAVPMRALLATLPNAFRPVPHGAVADLCLIDGRGGWTATAAEAPTLGTRTLVVLDPAVERPEAIMALAATADRTKARVVLGEGRAGHPILDHLAARQEGAAVQTMHGATGSAIEPLLFDILRVARRIGVQRIRPIDVAVAPGAAVVTADAEQGGGPVLLRLSARRSGGGTEAVTIVTHAGPRAAVCTLPRVATAAPATLRLIDEEEARALPDVFETAHRVVLRVVAAGTPLPGAQALRDFAADVALLDAWLAEARVDAR